MIKTSVLNKFESLQKILVFKTHCNQIIAVVGNKNDINSSLLFSTYILVTSVKICCRDLQLLITQ